MPPRPGQPESELLLLAAALPTSPKMATGPPWPRCGASSGRRGGQTQRFMLAGLGLGLKWVQRVRWPQGTSRAPGTRPTVKRAMEPGKPTGNLRAGWGVEAQDRCRERLSGSACLGRLWVREVRPGAPGPETPEAVPPDSKDRPPISAFLVLRRVFVACDSFPPSSAPLSLQRPDEKQPARGDCWGRACPRGPGCWWRGGLLTERRPGPLWCHRRPGAGSGVACQFQGSLPARGEQASQRAGVSGS